MKVGELAYIAGVIDCLGLVNIRETETSKLAQITVSFGNLDLLKYCAERTGVGVTTVTRDYKRMGCSSHCDEPHLHVTSVTGRWQLVGARAVIVLLNVQPYLVSKAKDAADVLDVTADAPRKGATSGKMRGLGWKTNYSKILA